MLDKQLYQLSLIPSPRKPFNNQEGIKLLMTGKISQNGRFRRWLDSTISHKYWQMLKDLPSSFFTRKHLPNIQVWELKFPDGPSFCEKRGLFQHAPESQDAFAP